MSNREGNSSGTTELPDLGLHPVLLRPELDRILDCLRSRRRRLILLLLKDGTIERKSDVMFRCGPDGNASEIELVHRHLPKLAEAGYVEWDPDTERIAKGPRFGEVEPVLELMERHVDEMPSNCF
ncbi:hypothetical protein [Halorubrum sp. DTA98]|uniref:hypothetical protein n=1 Tax=Halorubrum sp. DTA98 TaxID=3402163 RepID=UPI003AAF5A63